MNCFYNQKRKLCLDSKVEILHEIRQRTMKINNISFSNMISTRVSLQYGDMII